MSRWTHACCGDCWFLKFPDKAAAGAPCRALDSEEESCCFCSKPTRAGIFVRADPAKAPCNGVHPGHEDE